MLKRILVIFLMFSTLSYSSVWALGSHVDKIDISDAALSQLNETEHDDHQLDDDHCCHAGAHLLGLPHLNGDLSIFSAHPVVSSYVARFVSYQNTPPRRPPIS